MLNVAVDVEAGMVAQHIFRFRKNVLDVSPWDNAQPDFAINSAEGQIINFISERWNIRTLPGIQIPRQHFFPLKSRCGVSSNENGVYPPLYSPRRVPLIQTVEAVIAPSKSTKTRRPRASAGNLK